MPPISGHYRQDRLHYTYRRGFDVARPKSHGLRHSESGGGQVLEHLGLTDYYSQDGDHKCGLLGGLGHAKKEQDGGMGLGATTDLRIRLTLASGVLLMVAS